MHAPRVNPASAKRFDEGLLLRLFPNGLPQEGNSMESSSGPVWLDNEDAFP
jgi:hypothetical protein